MVKAVKNCLTELTCGFTIVKCIKMRKIAYFVFCKQF